MSLIPGNRFNSSFLEIFMLLACICSPSFIFGQPDTLIPGNPLPRCNLLKNENATYVFYSIGDNGKLGYFFLMNRTVKKTSNENTGIWIATQTYHGVEAEDVDSSFFHPRTLQPVGYYTNIRSEGHKESVTFNGAMIFARIIKEDTTQILDQSTPIPVFSSVMEEDIIRSLPLKKGYEVVIPFINPGAHYGQGLFYKHLTVLNEELVAVPGSTLLCWKIRLHTQNREITQWVSKKDQQLIKQVSVGAAGTVAVKLRLH